MHSRKSPFLTRWLLASLSILISFGMLIVIFSSVERVAAQTLQPDAFLTGYISTPEVTTLPSSAAVHLFIPQPQGMCCQWEAWAQTSGSGHFSFDLNQIPPQWFGHEFVLQAEPQSNPYFRSVRVSLWIYDSTIPINLPQPIRLTYASFQGDVRDPMNFAAQGGIIEIVDDSMPPQQLARSDIASGTFTIGGVPDGNHWLMAIPPEDSLFWASIPLPVTVNSETQYSPGNIQTIGPIFFRETNVTSTIFTPDWVAAGWEMSSTLRTGWVDVKADDFFGHQAQRPTAADGRFGLLLEPAGLYTFWAMPRGTLAYSFTESIPVSYNINVTPQQIPPIRLTYPSFQGYILNPLNGPVEECVTISLLRRDNLAFVKQQDFCSTATTTYRMGGVPDGEYYLQAMPGPHSGYTASDLISITVQPGTQYQASGLQWVDLYLNQLQAGQVNVFVRDPQGFPTNGQVQIWDGELSFFGMATPSEPARFSGLTNNGMYQVQAWPEDNHIPLWANSPAETIFVTPGPITLTQQLRWPNLTGQVTTPEEDTLPPVYDLGHRVRPAEVRVLAADWSDDFHFTTNISGSFSLATRGGDYFLAAYPLGPLAMTYTHSVPFSLTLDLIPPPSNYPNVRLTYPRLRGTVLDPWGSPTPANIRLWRADGNYQESLSTLGNPGEHFAFGGLPQGQYYVQAESDAFGFGPSSVYSFTMSGSPYTQYGDFVTLTLQATNFEASVYYPGKTPHGFPAPGVRLRVQQISAGFPAPHWGLTDEYGQSRFSGLLPAQYRVEFFLTPNMLLDWRPPEPYTFTLSSSTDFHAQSFHLRYAPQNKTLAGDVHDTDGNPVIDQNGDGQGDARIVAVHANSGQERSTLTSPVGAYTMTLGPGRWWLRVEPNSPTVDWLPGDGQWVEFSSDAALTETIIQPLTVTRVLLYPVTGLLLDPTMEPPPTATVGIEACSDEGQCFGAMNQGDGSFHFQAPPGVYRLWVHVSATSGWLPPLGNGSFFTVQGPTDLGTLHLRSQAERSVHISGRALHALNGNGLGGVGVAAWNDLGDWSLTDTNASGNYQLRLTPGYIHTRAFIPPNYQDDYVILPPQEYEGLVAANTIITGVNYLVRDLDATIQGTLVDQEMNLLPEVYAVVFAALCDNGECWVVDETAAVNGVYELQVIGGYSYWVGVWIPWGGYYPGEELPLQVPVNPGQTIPNLSLPIITANSRIHGSLVDQSGAPVALEAYVYGSGDGRWAEDALWPGKDPYEFNLFVPTPVSATVTWTLGLWVDPASGYIPDPAYPGYEVALTPGMTDSGALQLHVVALDAIITGTVQQEDKGIPAGYVPVFAHGMPGTPSAGLYFETWTDEDGLFTLPVVGGQYLVNTYLPPELAATHFRPQPVVWQSAASNPVALLFQRRGAVSISGSLSVFPASSLPADTVIQVFGASTVGHSAVTGTLGTGYTLPVVSGTQWTVWAVYENPATNVLYRSQPQTVNVGAASQAADLLLTALPGGLPDARCWTFDASQYKRLTLPAAPGQPAPNVEIPAGTFPVEGQVEVCARPMLAVPGGNSLIGFAYELEARDSQGNLITQEFNKKVRLGFYADPANLPAGVTPDTLQVMFYSPARGEWTPLEDLYVNPVTGFVTGTTWHFTKMGVHPTSVVLTPPYSLYLPLVTQQGSNTKGR